MKFVFSITFFIILSSTSLFAFECSEFLGAQSPNSEYISLAKSTSQGMSYSQKMFFILNKIFTPYVNYLETLMDSKPPSNQRPDGSKLNSKILKYFNQVRFERSEPVTTEFHYSAHSANYSERMTTLMLDSIVKKFNRQAFTFEGSIINSIANILVHNVSKNRTVWNHLKLKKRPFKKFVWSYSLKTEYPTDVQILFESSITPVGYYGENFAIAMMLTTQTLQQIILSNPEISNQIYSENQDIFLAQTTARSEPSEGTSKAPLMAMLEGVISLNQLLSSLMAQKVPNQEYGVSALKSLIFNGESARGLTTELTFKLPMGLLGPLILSGHGFDNPLALNSKNKLELSPELIEQLKELKIMVEPADPRPNGTGGVGCPMATCSTGHAKSGIQVLSELYFSVFKTIYPELIRERSRIINPKKVKKLDQILDNNDIEESINELVASYQNSVENYFFKHVLKASNSADITRLKILILHPKFNLNFDDFLRLISNKNIFYEILEFYISMPSSKIKNSEIEPLLISMKKADDLSAFTRVLNHTTFINAFLNRKKTDPIFTDSEEIRFRNNINLMADFISESQDPSFIIKEFFKSEIWLEFTKQEQITFCFDLISKLKIKFIFEKEVLGYFSKIVNTKSTYFESTLLLKAAEINHPQLLNYFISLPHADLNQWNKHGAPLVFLVAKQRLSGLLIFNRLIHDNRVDLSLENRSGESLLEILVNGVNIRGLIDVLSLHQFTNNQVTRAILKADKMGLLELKLILTKALNEM